MLELIKAIVLGVVEGITEFLPVSSTGHLIIVAALLDFGQSLRDTFIIFIQLGAVVAVVLFYWRDLWYQLTHFYRDRAVLRLWGAICIAFLPAAVIGVLFGSAIKARLFSPITVASALIAVGILFIIIEKRAANQPAPATTQTMEQITSRQALIVGLSQLFAFIPGTSRSGASIIGGMLAGMNRKTATQFSFYLSIPTLGGATIYDLWENRAGLTNGDLGLLLVGAVVSGIVAWLAIRWLLRYVSSNDFVPFGWYRILAGVFVFILILLGVFA